jgi:hypothetical protein
VQARYRDNTRNIVTSRWTIQHYEYRYEEHSDE